MEIREPTKLPIISRSELEKWFGQKSIKLSEPTFLASGVAHLRLYDAIFPGIFDVKKAKVGFPEAVAAHNWKLFIVGLAKMGVRKTFDVDRLKVAKSVEMTHLNQWTMAFIELNEGCTGAKKAAESGAKKSASVVSLAKPATVSQSLISVGAIRPNRDGSMSRRGFSTPKPSINRPPAPVIPLPGVAKSLPSVLTRPTRKDVVAKRNIVSERTITRKGPVIINKKGSAMKSNDPLLAVGNEDNAYKKMTVTDTVESKPPPMDNLIDEERLSDEEDITQEASDMEMCGDTIY